MPNNTPYGLPGKALQPEPRIIDNAPQKTVAAALASGKAQVNATKKQKQ
jgi:hypothetical protein